MLIITFTSNDQIQRSNHFATNYKLRNIFFFSYLVNISQMAPCLQESPTGHQPITVASPQHLFSQTPHKLTPRGQEILYATKHAQRHACLSGTLGSCVPSGADVTTLEPGRARVGMPPAGFQAFRVGFRPRLSPLEKRIERGQATNNLESETSLLGPRNTQWHA